jgi:hypothetical protein
MGNKYNNIVTVPTGTKWAAISALGTSKRFGQFSRALCKPNAMMNKGKIVGLILRCSVNSWAA